jgi:RND superfamily putative drug exporter
VGILLDATVIRALLVPSAIVLLGDANWWFPNFASGRARRARAVE